MGDAVAAKKKEKKEERADEWVGKPAPPCAMVIFGATGDLTKRKLIPALYNLIVHGLLPEAFAVVGVGRSELSDDEFRQRMEKDLKEVATAKIDPRRLKGHPSRLCYVAVEPETPRTFKDLADALAAVDEERGTAGNYLFYLAVPPSIFEEYVDRLGETGLMKEPEGS